MRRALCALSVAGVALGGLVIGVAPAQAAHVQSLNTTPGTDGTARLVFRLPASATVPPGEHPLRLRATSGASGASTVASGTVLIPGATPPPVDDDDGAGGSEGGGRARW